MMFEQDVVASDKKKWKLTDDEYNSLPSVIRVYNDRGRPLPDTWMKNYRKDNPAQRTRQDSVYLPLTDAKGNKTGQKVGFDKELDAKTLRQFKVNEANKLGKKGDDPTTKPKSTAEAYQRKIDEFSGKIGDTALDLSRVSETGAQGAVTVLENQLESYADSVDVYQNKLKALKESEKSKKVKELPKSDLKQMRSVANQFLANPSIQTLLRSDKGNKERVNQLFKKKFGITLQELYDLTATE